MRIERDIIKQLKVWKDAPYRKPILLQGARPSNAILNVEPAIQCRFAQQSCTFSRMGRQIDFLDF